MANTNYEELIPRQVLLSIKDLNDHGIIKTAMCKKLLYKRELETVKIGAKNFVSRTEVIRYLTTNTIPTISDKLSA